MKKQMWILEYETFDELKEQATALVMALGKYTEVNAPVEEVKAEPKKAPKAKKEKAPEAVEEVPAKELPVGVTPGLTTEYTRDEVMNILVSVTNTKNDDQKAAKEILKSLGFDFFREVPKEKYPEVVELCKKAIA